MTAQSHNPAQTRPETGAMPAALRFSNPQWTGQFLHEEALKTTLFFAGEGQVARSFTVLVALASKPSSAPNADPTCNGLAVIDNDNWRIVADRCLPQASGLKGASRDQRKLFLEVTTMDWSEFSAFCRSQATYRSGSPDLDARADVPAEGNAERQAKLGLIAPAPAMTGVPSDIRSDLVRSLHDAGEYNLPPTSREGMVKDLMMRQSQTVRGRKLLSWDIGLNYAWDRSGRVEGGEILDADFDRRWMKEMAANPDHLRTASDRALAPYVVSGFNVLELGESAGCELNIGGDQDNFLMLSTFGEHDLSFRDFRELREKLAEIPDDTLLNLWTTVRVLDRDLNRQSRAYDVAWELNEIRAALEEEWLMEVDEEVHLVMQ